MRPRARSHTRRLVAVLCVVVLAGCGNDSAVLSNPTTVAPPPDDPRGTVLEIGEFPTDDANLVESGAALRTIRFRSTQGLDNAPTEVSGVVAVPPGDPPAGGWPIISYGHGTSGIRTECGPSLSPNLAGSAENVGALVRLGYVVVMSDYQGLGYGTGHRYLEPRTAGYNMIDAARAARYVVPGTSPDWVAYGFSQGGQAAWAAHDLAPVYGGEPPLNLVGTVALAPVADVVNYAAAARDRRLTPDQKGLYAMLVTNWAELDPTVDLSDYLRGSAADRIGELTSCLPNNAASVATEVSEDDLTPIDDAAYEALEFYTTSLSLPTPGAAPTSPMQVIYGQLDAVVTASSTTVAIGRACAQGDSITAVLQPGNGHAVDASPSLEWMADRFDGAESASSC